MRLVVSSDSKKSFSVRFDGISIQFDDIGASKSICIEKDGENFSVDVISLEECVSSIVDSTMDIPKAVTVESISSDVSDTIIEPVKESFISISDFEDALFVDLVGLRTEISKELLVPPYIVFNNKTLRDMAQKRPLDLASLKSISGVGDSKLEKFGERFLKVIVDFVSIE